jgi:hypothetical protein
MHLKTLGIQEHNMNKCWVVEFHVEFAAEVRKFPHAVRGKLKAAAIILSEYGPQLGRPYVDTLNGSRYAKMKELRFNADGGAWRVAFAFDLERKAILLVGGDKAGIGKTRFYRDLIHIADERFDRYLQVHRSSNKESQ